MKTSSLFITTLAAAAAMSVPAYADTTWSVVDNATGKPQTTDFTEIADANPASISSNSSATYTTQTAVDTAGYSLQINGSSEINIGNITGGGAVWFNTGYWQAKSSSFSGAGDLYFLGDSHVQFGENITVSNNIFLGQSTKTVSGNGLSGTAIRIGVYSAAKTVSFTGTTHVLSEGATIAFQNGGVLNVSSLSGSGNLGTSYWTDKTATNQLNISGASDYTGKIDLASAVLLNWSSSTDTFGGLSGTGTAAGGSNLNIKDAKEGSTFSGAVGSADSTVALTLSGTGTQTFSGTNYFGAVSVEGGTLSLGGTVNLSNAIQVSGGAVMLADTVVFNLSGQGQHSLITGADSIDGWDNLSKTNFTINGEHLSGRLSLDTSTLGTVTVSGTAANLVWNAGTAGGTWSMETTDMPWRNGDVDNDAFYADDSVTFSTADASVTVSGTVTPASIAVEENTTFTGGVEIAANAAALGAASSSVTVSGGQLEIGSGESSFTYKFFDADTLDLGNVCVSLGEGWNGWQIGSFDTTTGLITIVIPEPSAFGLLAGVGVLALVAARRRRSRK